MNDTVASLGLGLSQIMYDANMSERAMIPSGYMNYSPNKYPGTPSPVSKQVPMYANPAQPMSDVFLTPPIYERGQVPIQSQMLTQFPMSGVTSQVNSTTPNFTKYGFVPSGLNSRVILNSGDYPMPPEFMNQQVPLPENLLQPSGLTPIVTSADAIANNKALLNLHYDPVISSRHKEIARRQLESEEKIVLQRETCPIEHIQKHLEALDPVKLKNEVTRDFQNPSTMQSTSCIMDVVTNGVYYSAPDLHGELEIANSITNWFMNMKRIGAESAEGVAMLTSFKNTGGMAVIKVAQDASNTEFVHELFIGSRGTNSARKDIPNFAYIYGGFKCSPPVINPETKEVISICANKEKQPVQYVIYENISPAIDVKQALKDLSPEEYLSAFFQVLLATHYGHQNFDWTHYDLHVENVLLREVPEQGKSFFIRYPYQGKNIYVRANRIATIIDYGRSHIKYKGRDYGYDGIGYGIFQEQSFPMYDIYKFLMFSAMSLLILGGRRDTYELLEKLHSYFNPTESLENDVSIQSQNQTYFKLPLNEKTQNLTIPKYFEFIRLNLKELSDFLIKSNIEPTDSLLSCQKDMHGKQTCKTSNKIYEEVGLNDLNVRSIIDFYDQSVILSQSDNISMLRRLTLSVKPKYKELMQKHLQELDFLVKDLKALISSLVTNLDWFDENNSPNVYQTHISLIYNQPMYEAVNKAVLILAKARFLSQRAALYAISGKNTSVTFSDSKTSLQMDSYLDQISSYQMIIKDFIMKTEKGIDYIVSLGRQDKIVDQSMVNNYENIKYYI